MAGSTQVNLTKAVKAYLSQHGKMTLGELDGLIYTIYGEAQLMRIASNARSKAAKKAKLGESLTESELFALIGIGIKQRRYSFLFACKNRQCQWLVRDGDEIWLARNGSTQAE